MTFVTVAPCAGPVRTMSRVTGSVRSQMAGKRIGNVRQNGCRVKAFFKIGGTNAQEGGIYGSQGRDDYEDIDLEHYFNYIGALAEDGTYDRLYALSDSGLEPIDAILVLAAKENDTPKIEEICEAGADLSAKDLDGKMAIELATKPETRELIMKYMKKQGVPMP